MKRKTIAVVLVLVMMVGFVMPLLQPENRIMADGRVDGVAQLSTTPQPLPPPQISTYMFRVAGNFLYQYTPIFTGVAVSHGGWGQNIWFIPPVSASWDMVFFDSLDEVPYIIFNTDWENFEQQGFFDRYRNRISDAPYISNEIWITTDFLMYDLENNGVPIIILISNQFIANGSSPFAFYRYVNEQYQYMGTEWSTGWGHQWGSGFFRAPDGQTVFINQVSTGDWTSAYNISFSDDGLIQDHIGSWEWDEPPVIDIDTLTPILRLMDLEADIRRAVNNGEFPQDVPEEDLPEEDLPEEDVPEEDLPEYTPAEYEYIQTPPHQAFTPEVLSGIADPATAQTEINSIVTNLTQAQRQSADALNIITLTIENIARMGTTLSAPEGGRFSADLLNSGAQTAAQIRHSTQAVLADEDVALMRVMRTNINFVSDDISEIAATFPEDVSGVPFDNVTIESEFAAITLDRGYIPIGGEVNVRRVESDGPQDTDNDSAADSTEAAPLGGIRYRAERLWGEVSDFSSPLTILANFWSVLVIIVLLIIWFIVAAKGERLRRWVVPTFALLALAANVALIMLRIEPAPNNLADFAADTVEVTMTPGMKATLSLPANGSNPDFLVLVNEEGEIQHSRYNPVTGNIDARIRESGTFTLIENEITFADIDDKNQLMQDAIRQLASRGIMHGAAEGYFQPDAPITRTDLVATIIMAFDMLDLEAQTSFTDIDPRAWYYLAVATAEQAGLIDGFADGTFRGEMEIPKEQLVAMAANTLMQRMGYHVPADIEYFLSRFLDRDQLAPWSEEGIALATASNVLIHRADGMFAPRSAMTRGDAAIILYRVFSRVW